MEMPELPYEIWLYIVGFLPRDTLLRLYSVNRVLFRIVQNERYAEPQIFNLEDESNRRFLTALAIPGSTMTHCVRRLYLRPHALGVPLFHQPEPFWKLWKWRNGAEIKRRKDREMCKRALQNLNQLTQLERLELQWVLGENYLAFKLTSPFITEAWKTYTHTLQILVLQIPLEAYRDLDMIPISLFLASLRDLTIHVFAIFGNVDADFIMKVTLATFINNHRGILESLRVRFADCYFRWDPTSLFSRLEDFPKLIELDFGCSDPDNSIGSHHERIARGLIRFSGLKQFISIHADRLERLQLQSRSRVNDLTLLGPWPPEELLNRDIFATPFPRLKSLNLLFARKLPIHELCFYLSCVRNTLAELTLDDKMLSFSELKAIIPLFESQRLRSLDIPTRFISPDLFMLISTILPGLDRLRVVFDSCVGAEDPIFLGLVDHWQAYDRVDDFLATMRPGAYAQWNLRHMIVRTRENAGVIYGSCKSALVKALPMVKSFNGMDPEDFLACA